MAVVNSPSGDMTATSFKAISAEHAVIRLYGTTTWQQILPPLAGHKLAIMQIVFSPDAHSTSSAARRTARGGFRIKEDELGTYHTPCRLLYR